MEVSVGDETLVKGISRDGAMNSELGIVVFRGGLNLELLIKRFQFDLLNCGFGSAHVCRIDRRSAGWVTYTWSHPPALAWPPS